MKYLVTGGAGFIGSNLVEELLNMNNIVIVVDDLSSGFKENLFEHNNLIFIEKRIQDIKEIIDKFDGIFHLAAQASVPVSIDDFYKSSANNLLSSFKVLEIAKNQKIPIVFASSSAIYGNMPIGDDEQPAYEILSPYAQDKLTLEDYSKLFYNLYSVSSIGLRFFNVYGPKQDPSNPYSGVISIFIEKFLKNQSITINGGYQTRDFIYIKDIVDTLITAMRIQEEKQYNEFINVGTGVSITIDDLYLSLSNIFNYNVEKNYKPLPFGDPEKSVGNYKKLRDVLNIKNEHFVSLKDGLANTIDYFKNIID